MVDGLCGVFIGAPGPRPLHLNLFTSPLTPLINYGCTDIFPLMSYNVVAPTRVRWADERPRLRVTSPGPNPCWTG